MRYAMAIDIEACAGCHACTIACKSNNNLPTGILWNNVTTKGGEYIDAASGEYPASLEKKHYPINCQHCSKPACVAVCPTGASYQREDGIVAINQDECLGCDSCATACPYDVRRLYPDDLGYCVDFPLGDYDAPTHKSGTMGKCTFCANRIGRGEKPACMELCLGRARYWGDMDDPNSEISKFLEGKEYERLLEDSGTEPNVYYVK